MRSRKSWMLWCIIFYGCLGIQEIFTVENFLKTNLFAWNLTLFLLEKLLESATGIRNHDLFCFYFADWGWNVWLTLWFLLWSHLLLHYFWLWRLLFNLWWRVRCYSKDTLKLCVQLFLGLIASFRLRDCISNLFVSILKVDDLLKMLIIIFISHSLKSRSALSLILFELSNS